MKYPYSVKFNGRYYRPNTEIPETVVETPVETVENNEVEETATVETPVETVEKAEKPTTKRGKKA